MADMNLGFGGSNPYVQNQAKALQDASNQNLQQNVLPGIGQGAQAAGMYGSSRQGIAEGQAMANAQTGLNNSIANLYSSAYGQDQNAQLQREGMGNQFNIANMQNATAQQGLANNLFLGNQQNAINMRGQDQSYALGQGQLGLGYQNSNNQFALGTQANNNQATANQNSYNLGMANNGLGYANLDANNAQFGANFGLQSQNYQNQWANNNALTANTIANSPLNYFNQFNQNANAIAGQGGSTSQTASGNPYVGALAGMQLYNAYSR